MKCANVMLSAPPSGYQKHLHWVLIKLSWGLKTQLLNLMLKIFWPHVCTVETHRLCVFWLQAVNVTGVGPFSDAVLCQTPCSVPAAVSSVHALRESEMRMEGEVTERGEEEDEDEEDESEEAPPLLYSPSTCLGLRWEPPCNHGAEITSYLIDLGEKQPVLTGPVTKYIIQNLQPDTTYRYRHAGLSINTEVNAWVICSCCYRCSSLSHLFS